MSGSNSSDLASRGASVVDESTTAPLTMAVHALPPADVAARTPDKVGRTMLWLVLLVCLAPVVASYLTYYVLRPEGRRVYGELIEPQRALPEIVAQTLDGRSFALPELAGQWLLLMVDSGDCGERCQRHLYLQRQLRESLGRERDRVDRVWLIPDDRQVASTLRPALTQVTVARVPEEDLRAWLQAAAGHELADHLYVVDPMGNWMMRFPAGLDVQGATRAKRDLDRLLRASASWDQPGRSPGRQGAARRDPADLQVASRVQRVPAGDVAMTARAAVEGQ